MDFSIYERLALAYAEKNIGEMTTPEELLSVYRDALDRIQKCDKEHGGKPFSLS